VIWFPRIDTAAFQRLVLEEQRPVILAHVRYDTSLAPVVEAMWHLRLSFGDAVAMGLLNAECDEGLGTRLGLSEAPVFVLYHHGKEVVRLPGGMAGPDLAEAILLHDFFEIS
jgi:hypothetical protein